MWRLGLRMSRTSGGWSLLASGVVAVAVAVGTAAMLVLLSVSPAMSARADRVAWAHLSLPEQEVGAPGTVTTFTQRSDIGQHAVVAVAVGADTQGAPVPPGVPRLPRPGEAFVSPALQATMAKVPAAQGRFGRVVGQITADGLQGPDELVVLYGVGASRAALSGVAIQAFPTQGETYQASGTERLTLLLAAAALAVMVASLVAASLRMTATRRRRRMAALGLLGASGRQVAQIAEGEMLPAAVIGSASGLTLFIAARPIVADYSYDGSRFFVDDLWPGAVTIVGVLVAILALCVLGTRLSMRGVVVDALAVVNEAKPRRRKAWRWVPLVVALVAGPALLAWQGSRTGDGYVVGIFLILMVGIVTAGPELTRAAGRVLTRIPRTATVLAGNRLAAHPEDGFRAAAGLALALLISASFIALVPASAQSVTTEVDLGQRFGTAQAELPASTAAEAEQIRKQLITLAGVAGPTAIRTAQVSVGDDAATAWIGDCASIAEAARLVDLPCGGGRVFASAALRGALQRKPAAELYNLKAATPTSVTSTPDPGEPTVATLSTHTIDVIPATGTIDLPDLIVDPKALTPQASSFRPDLLLFSYENDIALERARTIVEASQPGSSVQTRQTRFDGFSSGIRRLNETVTAAAAALALISTLALGLSTVSALIERRRFDTTLRVIGVPASTLRVATLIETTIPLAVASAAAAILGGGFGAAVVVTTTDLTYPLGHALPVLALIIITALILNCVFTLLAQVRTQTDSIQTE